MSGPIFLGIPTLCRHDLCRRAVDSALAGTLPPHLVYVVDNSGGFTHPDRDRVRVINPVENLGVARSWDLLFFLTNGRDLVISNDDVTFRPDSIERAARTPGPMVALGHPAYSCFLIRRECWARAGLFPWDLPGLAYFEDNWHHRKMRLAGIDFRYPDGGVCVDHAGSQTIAGLPEVHRRTVEAGYAANQQAYLAAWGGLPGEEKFTTPYGRPDGDCHGC